MNDVTVTIPQNVEEHFRQKAEDEHKEYPDVLLEAIIRTMVYDMTKMQKEQKNTGPR